MFSGLPHWYCITVDVFVHGKAISSALSIPSLPHVYRQEGDLWYDNQALDEVHTSKTLWEIQTDLLMDVKK